MITSSLNHKIIKIKKILRKHYRLILTIMFSLIAIILYGSISLHDNIWYDEAYQLLLTKNNLFDIIKYIGRDYHVPFYSILLKLVTLITGITPFVGRMVSLSAMIACFFLTFFKIKDLFSLKTSIIFSSFLLSFSCFYYSSIEIRPYGWSMFLTLASSIYMLSFIKNKDNKSLILYGVFSILSMYSHNMGMLYIFCNDFIFLLYILIKNRKDLKKVFLVCISQLLLYLPWLNILNGQVESVAGDYWIPEISLSEFLNDCQELIARSDYVIYLLIIFLVISFIYIIIKRKNKQNSLLLLCSFSLTFLFIYLISIYKMPLLIPRYLVTFIGVFVLFISDILGSVKSKFFLVILLSILIYNSYDNYKYEYKKTSEENLKSTLEYFEQENLVFIHYSEFALGEFMYHFPNATHFYTKEIVSNLRDYEMFGSNLIKLENIKDLDNYDISILYVSNLEQVRNAKESREYFKTWEVIDSYTSLNTYYFGRNYFIKLKRNYLS